MDLVGKMQELSILFNRLASSGCTACSQFEQHVNMNSRFYWRIYVLIIFPETLAGTNKCFHEHSRRIAEDTIPLV